MKKYIRSAIVSNEELAKTSKDPKVLAQLATDKDMWVRWYVARNPNTLVDVLEQLANDEKWMVRKGLAANPSTPIDILAQLANDESMNVRRIVAENPNTLADILAQLANDEDEAVRWFVARNLNTSADVLVQLANDEDKDVREVAAKNPNCPASSKKSKKSKKLNDWPSADEWYNIESDEAFENMWSRYLAGPEDEVNKKLQIFTEPSVQGGMGGMFIHDESRENQESFSVDFQYWCDQELNMAAESKNVNEYKQKYEAFVESLIDENQE